MNEIVNIFLENTLAQGFGLGAFIVTLIAYSSSNDRSMKIVGGVSLLIRAVHYVLLGLYTGGIIAIIGIFRNIYSIRFSGDKKIMYVFFGLYIIGVVLTYKALFSLFSLIAAFIYLYAFFNLKGVKLRYMMIVGNIFWILYAWYGQSIGLFISELVFTVTTIISIIRLKKYGEAPMIKKSRKNLREKIMFFFTKYIKYLKSS